VEAAQNDAVAAAPSEGFAVALARAREGRARADFRAGLAAAADAWDCAADDAERAQAGLLLALCRLRTGDLAGVLALADTLTPLLRRAADPELGEYLRWVTLAACDLGRFDVALPCAYEAHALAQTSGDGAQRAMALNAFGSCFERMGDPWQAERLLGEALPLARAHGTPRDLFVTLNNLCAVLIGAFHLLRGESTEAEALAALRRALPHAREALALAPGLAEPFVQVFSRGNLGEVLILLGEDAEGLSLLDQATAEARERGFGPQVQRMACTRAEWLLRHGRAAEALAAMEALCADGATSPSTAARAHHAAWRAARRCGDDARALHHLERVHELERRRSVQQLRAQSEQFITRFEAEQTRREAERQRERALSLEADALRDQLTGLGNRRALAQRLPALLLAAAAQGQPLCLVTLDLDHFKQVNDRFGHPLGDRVLVELAHILRANMRTADLVVRTGGEEFLAVLPQTAADGARELCERLRLCIRAHDWSALAPGLRVTASIGIAATPPYDATLLTVRSDAALYRAKALGRDRVVCAGDEPPARPAGATDADGGHDPAI
jgi:diguanylate cyclase (GGDEF)-like protein